MPFLHATASSWVFVIARTLRRRYLCDPEPLLNANGIDSQRLNDPDYRVPVVQMTQLWRQVVAVTGDEAFGLEVAQQVSPLTFQTLGVETMRSANLHEAVFRVIQKANTVSDVAKLSIQGQQDALWLRFDVRDDSPAVAVEAIEAFMGAVIHIARHYVHVRPPLRAVHLKRAMPAAPARYETFFQVPVRFGAECDALESSIDGLAVLAAMPAQEKTPDPGRDGRQPQWQAPDLRWQVMEAIDRLLPDHAAQEHVAIALNMSVRTLQRRLAAVGSSFQALLDAQRQSLAERWLQENRMTIQQVSDALGFANPSAFTRAFRRWKACAPEHFREQHARDNGRPPTV